MKGKDVLVRRPLENPPKDALGHPTRTWAEPETVHDVIVASGYTLEVTESNRPYAMTVAYTLTFPSTYTDQLRGCEVKVPGDSRWYAITGDPKPMPGGQLRRPLRWNRTAEAVRGDG